MRRFAVNRWWAFILALLLGVAGVLSMPRTSLADTNDVGGKGIGSDGSDGSGDITPGGGIDPQGAGDPDSPSAGGKSPTSIRGASGGYSRIGPLGVSGAGDAAMPGAARMWMRVRIALGVLKYYYLRF